MQDEVTIAPARDPNEKLVSPEGDVWSGDTLNYTINYENEGKGIAYGVYIADTLDEDLDDSTLTITGGGSYDPKTRTISWFIGEVGPGEEGLVDFSIKVKEDVPDNSEVINFATVYFPSVPEATRTNGTVNRIVTVMDNIPPTVTITANSDTLWPPNHKMIDVTIGGEATDDFSGIAFTEFKVTDEYGQVEPIISDFGNTIQLEAWREGDDLDGRIYTISATATDYAGNEATASTMVICPHDYREEGKEK